MTSRIESGPLRVGVVGSGRLGTALSAAFRAAGVEVDLVPAVPEPELDRFLQAESLASGRKQLAHVRATQVPPRRAETLLAAAWNT